MSFNATERRMRESTFRLYHPPRAALRAARGNVADRALEKLRGRAPGSKAPGGAQAPDHAASLGVSGGGGGDPHRAAQGQGVRAGGSQRGPDEPGRSTLGDQRVDARALGARRRRARRRPQARSRGAADRGVRSGPVARRRKAAPRAAHATAGEVLTYGAAPIAAYFSASCGGRSETAEAAFNLAPGSTPYLVSEPDDADPGRAWVIRKPLARISKALRKAGRVLS